ncbi:protease B nonderepressible form [Ascochyta rabiei]|uniref:Protein PBN1 n=1 Tax=Didymella rabiei TaxID=5454 RepID=A0A162XF47_DIDRA|nr:protease B nonderepressible form [Ascochyta rabiei]KZM19512.1 GPI anchor biosynthetic process [Ascochyta rabiei]UPX12465.1 protease B nonderepressible form [Ascochyta rabiei]
MKQRITYVVTEPESFNPEQISVQKGVNGNADIFKLNGVNAAKEHRITLGLDELSQTPIDIKNLKQWHELHIRWTSEVPYSLTPPFTSRVSPGLHIFFTPSGDSNEIDLCKEIQSIFGQHLKCSSYNETAIKMPMLSERFSMSTASQYYSPFSFDELNKSLLSEVTCPNDNDTCRYLKKYLPSASYVDLDYDAISQAWIFTAVWPKAPSDAGWTDTIVKRQEEQSTVEIGVLAHEPNTDPEDIQFGGFLAVLGQDDKPKPTRFQTPTRHYPLLTADPYNPNSTPKLSPLTYTTSLQRPTGLHPTLMLTFPTEHLTPPDPTCKLHTHLTLPSTLFIDKYQFNDPLFLASKNIIALRSIAGATDLEAPDWVVPQWGSASLFELASPSIPSSDTNTDTRTNHVNAGNWNISIPLHLRYLPASNASHTVASVPWPVVFWACRADEGEKMSVNPFDRRHLGYEALFGPKTRFMHVEPATSTGKMVETIDVPVLDTRKAAWVETGTVGVVLVAFLGLCWVLFGRIGGQRVEREKKKQ